MKSSIIGGDVMKKKYEEAKAEFIYIKNSDIIRTSNAAAGEGEQGGDGDDLEN